MDTLTDNIHVTELTATSFSKTGLLKNNKPTFVLFYKYSCKYCHDLKETWIELGKIINFLSIAAFNSSHRKDILEYILDHDVSYPTLILYINRYPEEIYHKQDRSLNNLLTVCIEMREKYDYVIK